MLSLTNLLSVSCCIHLHQVRNRFVSLFPFPVNQSLYNSSVERLLLHMGITPLLHVVRHYSLIRRPACSRRDSNPHVSRHQILSLAWLPLHHRSKSLSFQSVNQCTFRNPYLGYARKSKPSVNLHIAMATTLLCWIYTCLA